MRINPFFLSAAIIFASAGCQPSGSGATGAGGNGGKDVQKLTTLKIEDSKGGTGAPVANGDEVWVWYTGKLVNGKVFDSNRKKGAVPLHVTVGGGEVIKGWDQGLPGLKKGVIRKLSIPYALAYGDAEQKGIPARSDLYFDVELADVLKKEDADKIVAEETTIGTGREAKDGDTVTIDYVLTASGKEIENLKDVKFKIGGGDMQIDGFDTAVKGMKVGGKRKITIPPLFTRTFRNDKLGMAIGTWDVTLKNVK